MYDPSGSMFAGMKPDLTRLPADAAGCVNSPAQFIAFSNPSNGVEAPNAETPLTVTKNSDGSTATARGRLAGTSIVLNLPG